MTPHLDRHDVRRDPTGAVLLLHGGEETPGDRKAGALYPGYLRVWLLHRSVRGTLAAGGVASWLVRNTWASWSAPTEDDPEAPVADARAGLTALQQAYAGLPVVLVGHSMGARTALRLVGDPGVVGLVGLAPWFPEEEDVACLRDRHLAVAVNGADTEISPRQARLFVERAEPLAASCAFERIGDQGPGLVAHGMALHPRRWNEFAVRQARRMLQEA